VTLRLRLQGALAYVVLLAIVALGVFTTTVISS
jgi:hypothetical protein